MKEPVDIFIYSTKNIVVEFKRENKREIMNRDEKREKRIRKERRKKREKRK